MPEQPEQDPITSKSYAAYYLIAVLILMATLFWALWDRSLGSAPMEGISGTMERSLSCLSQYRAFEVSDLRERHREEP